MKIKNITSAKSELKPEVLMDKVISKLTEQGYIITDRTMASISFKDDNWQIRSRNKIFSKVDKGEFKIEVSGDGALIEYTYYISFLPELVITSIILIVSLAQNYLILFIALPLLIQLGIRIITLREVSEEMVMTIIGG